MGFIQFVARFIVWLLALVGLAVVAAIVFSFIFLKDFGRPDVAVPDQAVLTIDLSEGLAADHISLPFAPTGRPTIEDIVLGLEAAATDSRVKGLLLKVGRGPLDLAEAQEIRDAVTAF